MILNNSGIVHCATRTRGREETAMNMQELLTYVEELTFKTSMFGYDKDEVDIQLDKICDEAEAIILAKEKEIEELKKESKTALGIAAAATGKTMEELEKIHRKTSLRQRNSQKRQRIQKKVYISRRKVQRQLQRNLQYPQ